MTITGKRKMNDSLKTVQQAPHQVQPKIRIETPVGAIESDSGDHVIDSITVLTIILVLYIGKKVIDKFFRSKK